MTDHGEHQAADPSAASPTQWLRQWQGRRAWVATLAEKSGRPLGNHGDTLIRLAEARQLCEAEVEVVADPSLADVAVFPGSGSLLEPYLQANVRFSAVRDLAIHHRLPLVVAPSTIRYGMESFKSSFAPRGPTSIQLWARERVSLESCRENVARLGMPDIRCEFAHDSAFFLPDAFLAGLARGDDHVLVVERRDAESRGFTSGPRLPAHRAKAFVAHHLPDPVLRWGRRTRRRYNRLRSPMLGWVADNFEGSRVVYGDVSNPRQYGFNHFLDAIGGASVVVTQRLHVGILAALLGKQTVLWDNGSHFKLEAVYRASLSRWPHVSYVDAASLAEPTSATPC